MAECTKQGHAPLAGGALDQAAKFLDGARFVWHEQERNRAELQLEALNRNA